MEFGWKRIWKLYGLKELFSWKNKLFYFSVFIVASTVICILVLNHKDDLIYNLIQKIVDTGLSILPTLLGFNLGAYALIIGFLTNESLKKAVTKGQEDQSKNALERISSVFAINIITQAFTLLSSFLIKESIIIIEKLDLSLRLKTIFYSHDYVIIINYLFFIIIMFLTLYSIVLVIQNAINIFDFSQLFTYFSTKENKK
jgi:hypothetical protein